MDTRASRAWTRTTLLPVIVLAAAASVAGGQSAKQLERKGDPVIVALVADSVTREGAIKIVRDHRKGHLNVIYLRQSTATSLHLERAVRTLVYGQLMGGHPAGEVAVAILQGEAGESWNPATRALFEELRAAPRRRVGGAGLVPTVMFTLPGDDKLKEKFKLTRDKRS